MIHLGDVPAGSALYIPFATYAGSTGASATMTGLAVTDIEIYKNGSVTQRASDAGYALLDTDGIDFDGVTGIHGFSVDLSNNTDAGFFSVGGFYWVVVSSVTVDSQTVNFIAATFRVVAAETVTGYRDLPDGGITAAKVATGAIDADALATDAVAEIVAAILTTQMTESYAANGTAPTLAQALFMLWSFTANKSITGLTVTTERLDGTTDAMTFTLNNASNPTSIARAT